MWYTSKTLWVNALAVIALVAQSQWGYVLTPESQVAILGVVNLVLRAVTKTEIVWKQQA
jgi:hypothetical protein